MSGQLSPTSPLMNEAVLDDSTPSLWPISDEIFHFVPFSTLNHHTIFRFTTCSANLIQYPPTTASIHCHPQIQIIPGFKMISLNLLLPLRTIWRMVHPSKLVL